MSKLVTVEETIVNISALPSYRKERKLWLKDQTQKEHEGIVERWKTLCLNFSRDNLTGR